MVVVADIVVIMIRTVSLGRNQEDEGGEEDAEAKEDQGQDLHSMKKARKEQQHLTNLELEIKRLLHLWVMQK